MYSHRAKFTFQKIQMYIQYYKLPSNKTRTTIITMWHGLCQIDASLPQIVEMDFHILGK